MTGSAPIRRGHVRSRCGCLGRGTLRRQCPGVALCMYVCMYVCMHACMHACILQYSIIIVIITTIINSTICFISITTNMLFHLTTITSTITMIVILILMLTMIIIMIIITIIATITIRHTRDVGASQHSKPVCKLGSFASFLRRLQEARAVAGSSRTTSWPR